MKQYNYNISIPNQIISALGVGAAPSGTIKMENLVIQGNYAYIGSGSSPFTILIYNISNPAAPVLTGSLAATGNYLLAVQGNYLYWGGSGSSNFYIANISNPYNPVIIATLPITGTPGAIYGTAIAGNYAYLATQNKGLTVVNVTNPYVPVQIYQEGGTLNKSVGVAVANGLVYTTNYQTTAPWTVRYLKIWNVSNPAMPVLLETYTLPAGTKPQEVQVIGNYAYVEDANTNSVQIVDVTNPLAPNYLSSIQATNSFNVANNVAISGNYAYIASGSNATYGGSIDFYDITNKSAPVKLATYQEGVPTDVFGPVVIYNNVLYVADYGVAPGLSMLRTYTTQTALSNPLSVTDLVCASVQMSSVASTASGTYTLQGSDDSPQTGLPMNFSPIPGTQGTVSGSNIYLIPKTDLSYQYIQLAYTNTGTGGFNAAIKTLGFE